MKTIFEYTQSLIVMALVLAGLAGISYNLFREDGWVEKAVGDIWTLQLQYPLIAIPLTIGAVVLLNMFFKGNLVRGRKSALPDVLLYMMMAAGAYYIALYLIKGSFY